MAVMWIIECEKWWSWTIWYIHATKFYTPFITEVTPQVTMALRSERAMVRRRQKYGGGYGYVVSVHVHAARNNENWKLGSASSK